jgi:Porin PorA
VKTFDLPHRFWLGTAALWLIAAILRWSVAPAFELLPTDYVGETSYTGKLWSRQTVLSAPEESESGVRRRDQTLTCRDGHAIIQGDAHWLTPAGVVIFETLNLYGVDRNNRQNLAGYGNEDRSGQYLFPPHLEKKKYRLWDPDYAGPRFLTFDHVDQLRGIKVYVFNSLADGIDETAGFESLPDVPDKYHALSYGRGRFWIEPLSGIVVDYQDEGTSFFIGTKTGERVGEPMARWSARYTVETINAQLHLATAMRGRMLALELWLPLIFIAAGVIWIGVGFYTRRRGAP